MKRRKGREPTVLDKLDILIFIFVIQNKKVTIGDIKKRTGLTHTNLVAHMKRLDKFLNRKRDKQKIYVSINKKGIKLFNLLTK